jgi:2'-5' RNA ligase
MSGVAIVAIPNKSDPVWAVSSEKIPHMTLLFLGDALSKEDYRQVQEFVTHVADVTLPSFGMSVDKRDTLGDSDADVLFFKNNDKSRISLFRSYLLQDSIIREAYESVEQFEGWTPHLTLGYPETPAKKDPREDSEFYWVNFDRIMIWTGEYEGPEIELKSEDLELAMDGFDENLGLSQSDHEAGLAFLAQSGVKGMRWGVRRSREERRADRTAKVQAAAEKKVAKAEQYTARANAKAEVAKARTATADAKAAAANARLETKLAEKQAKFAKAEARSGKDDPANGLIRDTSGVVGSSNRESMKLRDAAAKDVRTLDDKTLADYTKRVDTEKKLKQAIKEDQAPAKTATKKLIADAGKDVAKTALVGAGSMAVFYLLGRVGASRGQNPKPKINWEGAANTTTNSKSKAKDAFDFAKEAADAARTTSVPKNKYPGAIPTTGRALPTTGSSAPPGYKRKPGFDPDNWTLRPGKKP